ncbi:MAG: glycosyltransferase [Candidatus Bathyarchaeia archaeon]
MRTVLLMPCKQAAGSLPNGVLDALLKLDPQPDLYVFCENNSTDRTLKWLADFPRPKEIIRLWFRDNALSSCRLPGELVAVVRDLLLQRARQLEADFAILMDADIMVHTRDLIPRLTSRAGDIVGGLCRFPDGFIAATWYAPMPGRPERTIIRDQPPSGSRVCEEVASVGGAVCV